MKELTSYNRAAGYLNKLFDLLNFNGGDENEPFIIGLDFSSPLFHNS